jgi:hypothetical protein
MKTANLTGEALVNLSLRATERSEAISKRSPRHSRFLAMTAQDFFTDSNNDIVAFLFFS